MNIIEKKWQTVASEAYNLVSPEERETLRENLMDALAKMMKDEDKALSPAARIKAVERYLLRTVSIQCHLAFHLLIYFSVPTYR